MKNIINIVTSVLFAAFLLIFTAAFVLTPDADFSEEENRSLTTFPKFTWERLLDGSFSSDINEYFADQFPARDALVGIKGVTETLLLKGENNGVLLGDDGQLAVRLFDAYKSRLERTPDMDYYYPENVAVAVDALNAFAKSSVVPVTTMIPPRTVDIASSAFDYPTEISDVLDAQLAESIVPEAGYLADLPKQMETRYNDGEYVYFRTDHHWTTYGAYIAYIMLMQEWDMTDEILPPESFAVETIENFYGTTWSRAGYKFVEPDTLEVWTPGNEDEFTTTCYTEKQVKGEDGKPTKVKEAAKTFPGWLNREYLAKKDKYAAFLDGTHNEQTVFKTTETGRPRLLIAKDSIANTMVPFLVQHFDLVIVNLAGRMTDLTEYINEYGCDRVLIVWNRANLIENNILAAIK
ncbi:MAG: hypothetical protein IJW81_04840 [Clostridia bacterium]|nr:hypothetical protein [Clostridia bacterium]